MSETPSKILDRAILRTDPDYDRDRDFGASLDAAYKAIRDRMANGGPGWEPRR